MSGLENSGSSSIDGIFCCLDASFVQYLQKFTLTFVHLGTFGHFIHLERNLDAVRLMSVENTSLADALELNMALMEISITGNRAGIRSK